MSGYRVQRCQITEVVFYTKVLVNKILVRLERIVDYVGVRLERFHCSTLDDGFFVTQNKQLHAINNRSIDDYTSDMKGMNRRKHNPYTDSIAYKSKNTIPEIGRYTVITLNHF